MSDLGYLERRAVDVLRKAVVDRDVVLVRKKDGAHRARTDVRNSRVAKYAYLGPGPGGSWVLSIYPGDSLTQAKILYGNPSLVRRLLTLRAKQWTIRPNFHFGFMEKGLTWTRTSIDVDAYIEYWLDRISATATIPRARWDEEWEELTKVGIIAPGDRPSFEKNFVSTDRQSAAPRPGLALEHRWSVAAKVVADMEQLVGHALEQAESVLGGSWGSPPTREAHCFETHFVDAVEIPAFEFVWPDATVEEFSRGWKIRARWGASEIGVRHGLAVRSAYGRERVRSVTWVGGIPTIEGAEADDYALSKCLISALRSSDKKLIRSDGDLPAELRDFHVVDHRAEIDAPYSRRGLAAKVHESDLETWTKLALLRAYFYGRLS